MLVEYMVADRVGYITLNRPEKRNALNQEMVSELEAAFQKASSDDSAKVIVLRARGEAFCAGADLGYLQQLQKYSYEENLADSSHLKELFFLIYTLNKVVIAEVQGAALAGGCGLAAVCDFVFTVPEAKFGYTEVKIGFIPAIVTVFLLRKIGESRAKELLLSGSLIS
ncbi:MAG TPA: enoyl-CoA hydratase/isomerase family protein, partial [Cyclobacteriaceae bacterium]|nr:enoyl-CoA hydratase/isomerase family protein [Cyclobacteriaceae bacterium]